MTSRPRTVAAGVALVVLVVACAALTGVRRGWWATGEIAYRGVHPGVERFGAIEYRRFREVGKVEVPDPGWRPLRVTLSLAPAPGAPQSRSVAVFAIDDRPIHHAVVGPGPTEVSFDVRTSPASTGLLGLQIRSETFDEAGRGVAAASARIEPEVGLWPVVRYALPGAVLGALLWWAWWWPALAAPSREGTVDGGGPPAAGAAQARCDALIFGGLAASLFLVWAVLRPPLQAPDESEHLVRVLASPSVPWLSRQSHVPVPGAACNPLQDVPWPLSKLPFHAEAHLSREDVERLRLVTWPRPPAPLQVRTQAWAYPPGFYHATALLGTPLVALTRATPYESTYVYRFTAAALSAVCWAWVMAALGHLGLTRRQRWFVAALCLANPMVPFMASSVSPDAVHVPLIVLALVYGHVALVQGRARGTLVVVLLLATLTKPSGLVAMAILVVMAASLTLTRRIGWREAVDGLRPVAGAWAVAYLALAMWVPLALYGTPRDWGLAQYWEALNTYGWRRWVNFWGQLGWLDYNAPDVFYVVLLWLFGLNVALGLPRLAVDWRRRGASSFLVLASLILIVGTLAGEYLNLARAGLTFQGRYVLPAMIGVGGLTLHRWRVVRWTFVFALLALHLSLAQRSIPRYFGDAETWCASLPWVHGLCSAGEADRPPAAPLTGLPACSGAASSEE